jgi:hypothetical protein
MQSLRSTALGFIFCALGWAGCRAQAPRTTAVVNHLSDSLTVVERGDTLLWIRGPSDAVSRDSIRADGKPVVMVALLLPDSSYVVLYGRRVAMNPVVAKHMRILRQMMHDEQAGRLPRPPQCDPATSPRVYPCTEYRAQ